MFDENRSLLFPNGLRTPAKIESRSAISKKLFEFWYFIVWCDSTLISCADSTKWERLNFVAEVSQAALNIDPGKPKPWTELFATPVNKIFIGQCRSISQHWMTKFSQLWTGLLYSFLAIPWGHRTIPTAGWRLATERHLNCTLMSRNPTCLKKWLSEVTGNNLNASLALKVKNSKNLCVSSALTVNVLKSILFSLFISFKSLIWYSFERLTRTSDSDTVGAMKPPAASKPATVVFQFQIFCTIMLFKAINSCTFTFATHWWSPSFSSRSSIFFAIDATLPFFVFDIPPLVFWFTDSFRFQFECDLLLFRTTACWLLFFFNSCETVWSNW